MSPDVQAFFDEATNTITCLVVEPQGRACAVIDSVPDFDHASGRTDTRSADAVVAFIEQQGFDLRWILEPHARADHLSAAARVAVRPAVSCGDSVMIGQMRADVMHTPGDRPACLAGAAAAE